MAWGLTMKDAEILTLGQNFWRPTVIFYTHSIISNPIAWHVNKTLSEKLYNMMFFFFIFTKVPLHVVLLSLHNFGAILFAWPVDDTVLIIIPSARLPFIMLIHFLWLLHREENSLHHVAMVAKFLDDNKPMKPLKSLFPLFQTLPILFNFI